MENNTVTETEIHDFAEANSMTALAGDMFEDAGGHVIHESEVIEMIEAENEADRLEWHRAEDEARRSADQLCSNESRLNG